MSGTVIVTGGSGYVGHQVCLELEEKGYTPISIDRNPRKFTASSGVTNFPEDINNKGVNAIMKMFKPVAVVHCAASTMVGKSFEEPHTYYENNISHLITLLGACIEHEVKNFVFISSSSVYGDIKETNVDGTIHETTELNPVSPYGKTKMYGEHILNDFAQFGLNITHIRPFNVAGADLNNRNGYTVDPKMHLIPILVDCAINDKQFTLNGTDYSTTDGTPVRDYTHVVDVARAIRKSVDNMMTKEDTGNIDVFNCGGGNPRSITEVIKVVESIIGKQIDVVNGDRREGDPDYTSADITSISKTLNWTPTLDLEEMVRTHYNWVKK